MLYSPELCKHAETDKCPKGDACPDSHNKVERLYHVEKYKTKFCSTYPKKLDKCEYGEYCSFAHSNKDIKINLLQYMKKDEDYYMHHFKTEWCPLTKEHNKAMCEYAHNWHDFRRKTSVF